MSEKGRTLAVRAPAKVNLSLEVLGQREDGYHEIRTVVQAVSFCDELRLRHSVGGRVTLRCDHPDVPSGEANLVVRAARLLRECYGVTGGVEITLRKRLPVGGGLGGGSADGAVALLALRELWDLPASPGELHPLAAELGSDVPFFLSGGRALCEGRGEVISPLPDSPTLHLVLVMPREPVSTAEVYRHVGSGLTESGNESNNVVEALGEPDLGMLGRLLRNDLQEAALGLHAGLRENWRTLKDFCERNGAAGCLLSGSGSSFFLIAHGAQQAAHFARLLRPRLGVPCAAVQSLPTWRGDLAALSV